MLPLFRLLHDSDLLWNRSLPNLLRATLKQAILYSPIPANPLQFILPPSPVLDGEALMQAAEAISTAVLASGKASSLRAPGLCHRAGIDCPTYFFRC